MQDLERKRLELGTDVAIKLVDVLGKKLTPYDHAIQCPFMFPVGDQNLVCSVPVEQSHIFRNLYIRYKESHLPMGTPVGKDGRGVKRSSVSGDRLAAMSAAVDAEVECPPQASQCRADRRKKVRLSFSARVEKKFEKK